METAEEQVLAVFWKRISACDASSIISKASVYETIPSLTSLVSPVSKDQILVYYLFLGTALFSSFVDWGVFRHDVRQKMCSTYIDGHGKKMLKRIFGLP